MKNAKKNTKMNSKSKLLSAILSVAIVCTCSPLFAQNAFATTASDDALKEEITSVKERIAACDYEIAETEKELAEYSKENPELEMLNKQLDSVNEEIDGYEADLKDANHRLTTETKNLASIEKTIVSLKADLAKLKLQKKKLEKDIANLSDDADENERVDLEKQLEDVNAEISDIEAQVETNDAEKEASKNAISSINDEISSTNKSLSDAISRRKEIKKEIEAYSESDDSIKALNDRIDTLNEEKATLETRLMELEDELKNNSSILRIYGETRYTTALKNADKLKEILAVDKFDAIVVATGVKAPDALSGSYLASQNNAPLLLINESSAASVRGYIRDNLNPGGRIIILGGEASVKDSWLDGLSIYTIDRIAGESRYETNLKILKEVGYTGGQILVATGLNYADSLSGSALDMPILLVDGKGTLTTTQKEFLSGLSTPRARMYIAGGTKSVSRSMATSLMRYGLVVKRFSGADRYETSKLIADEFFPKARRAILTVGDNFPDGLSAGPVAATIDSPILLTNNGSNSTAAAKYTSNHEITTGIVIGGAGSKHITDKTARSVFSDIPITIYEEGMHD